MEYKFSNEDIDVSKFKRKIQGKWANIVEEFMKTNMKNCQITCKNIEERKVCSASIKNYVKAHKHNICVYNDANRCWLIKC